MKKCRKALIVTTVSGFVPQFEMGNVKILQSMGYEVHYAANYDIPSYGYDNHRLDGTGIIRHQVPFVRSPYSLKNIYVYYELIRLMKQERFELVHCHTPMGGVMARLAAHATGTGPVIYTAHGFHFYHGAPLKNWLLYYPAEWFLSQYTDIEICINHEDFQQIQKLKSGKKYYIPGAGVDVQKFGEKCSDIKDKKEALGIFGDKKVLLSVGEEIERKNQELVIRALACLKDDSLVCVLCGHGRLEKQLKALAQALGVAHQMRFLGYREDMAQLYPAADILIHPSRQEGLPMAVLEAMASGLAVIGSDIRGNRDLIKDGYNGVLIRGFQPESYGAAIVRLLEDTKLRTQFAQRNRHLAKTYDVKVIREKMSKIYQTAMNLTARACFKNHSRQLPESIFQTHPSVPADGERNSW